MSHSIVIRSAGMDWKLVKWGVLMATIVIPPPLVGIPESIVAIAALLHSATKKKKDLNRMIAGDENSVLVQEKLSKLMSKLKSSKELLEEADIGSLESKLIEMLTNIPNSISFESFKQFFEDKADYKALVPLFDKDFFKNYTVIKRKKFNTAMKVKDLIEDLKNKQTAIFRLEAAISSLETEIHAIEKVDRFRILELKKQKIESENQVNEIKQRAVTEVVDNTEDVEKTIRFLISQKLPNRNIEEQSKILETAQKATKLLQHVCAQYAISVIQKKIDLIADVKSFVDQISLEETSKGSRKGLQNLKIQRMELKAKKNILAHEANIIFSIIQFLINKKAAKERLIHAAWCFTFVGAWVYSYKEINREGRIILEIDYDDSLKQKRMDTTDESKSSFDSDNPEDPMNSRTPINGSVKDDHSIESAMPSDHSSSDKNPMARDDSTDSTLTRPKEYSNLLPDEQNSGSTFSRESSGENKKMVRNNSTESTKTHPKENIERDSPLGQTLDMEIL